MPLLCAFWDSFLPPSNGKVINSEKLKAYYDFLKLIFSENLHQAMAIMSLLCAARFVFFWWHFFWPCGVFVAVCGLSLLAACGLGCSTVYGIFLDQESNPCLLHGRQILNHWTTREVPDDFKVNNTLHLFICKPWRRAWQPIPVFLPGESHGQKWSQSMDLQRVRHNWATKHS